MSKLRRFRGQGLVEFALILPALLMIVLSIIEGALLFQSYLAIQHAAREAARYAVTYQPPFEYSVDQGKLLLEGIDPGRPAFRGESEAQWLARRSALIKQRALDQAMGIRTVYPGLDESSFAGLSSRPGFFGVRIWGFPAHDTPEQLDHPGLQGLPIRVRVYYRWEALDPLIGAIVPNGVMLTGEAVMINEGVQTGLAAVAPPTFAPPPTLPGPTDIPTDPNTPTPTPSPSPTFTTTPATPTPTSTPTGAYVILTDDRDLEHFPWLLEAVPFGTVELHQHNDPGPYRVYWTDNCNQRTFLGMTVTTSGGEGEAPMPNPVGLLPGDSYLCGPLQEGGLYEGRLSTCDPSTTDCDVGGDDTAWNMISILVPVRRPDLVISRVTVPEPVHAGVPVIIDVEVTNQGTRVVSDTFDIDIYTDPAYTPILPGQPGFIASGTGSAKQWYGQNVPPGGIVTLSYAVTFPEGGDHTLWAQVDTSMFVEEDEEENNISGPVEFFAYCSEKCDDFDTGQLTRWAPLSVVGTGPGDGGSATIATDELRVSGVGSPIWNPSDGRFFLLNQGTYNGNFEMTVKVTDYPRNETGSMAGLMVRESLDPGARYAAIGVVNVGGQPRFQAVVRDTSSATPVDPCGSTTAISPFGDGVWVRIRREGDEFTLSTSTDGDNWSAPACREVTIAGFAGSAVPGIMTVPLPRLIRGDTGWRSPSANLAESGGDWDGFELNPGGAYANGGGYAESESNGAPSDPQDRHQYYNYGLNVPAGAMVEGIEVRLDWWLNNRNGTNYMDVELSWDGGSTWTAYKRDSWERSSERTSYLGDTNDPWGRVWTADELSNANFRVRLLPYTQQDGRDVRLDWVPVRVTYSQVTSTPQPDGAQYDSFELCPLDPTPGSTRTKPPLLRECGSVLSNAAFDGGIFAPWEDGEEPAAVVPDQTYSCDLDGRPNYGFGMLLRCDRMRTSASGYAPFHPWALQELTVPQFISTTEPVVIEMNLSLFYAVPPPFVPADPTPSPGMEPYVGTLGRTEDTLQAYVTELDDTPLTTPATIGNGGPPSADRGRFMAWSGDLAPLFVGGDSLLNHVGEEVLLWIDAPNVDNDGDGHEDGDSEFFIDQVRCDICTTVQPPDPQPGTVRRLGGELRVLIEGFARPMEGVDVWAMQLPDGITPPQSLGYYTTYSIHDSTYNFYNLNPGTYRIYAQVWVSGVLYSASETVTIDDPPWGGREKTDVNLVLQ